MQHLGEFTLAMLWVLVELIFAIACRISRSHGHRTHRN